MKIIITENQNSLIRRYQGIKEIVDWSINYIFEDEDFCDLTPQVFFNWVLRDIKDNLTDADWVLDISDDVIDDNFFKTLETFVKDHFTDYIMSKHDKLMERWCL
jgi:hypothetical protein